MAGCPSVVYLLEDAVLFGGVKVVLRQADLLAARGHEVTVVCLGRRPDWTDVRAEFRTVAAFTPDSVPAADVTVATHWTTLNPALDCAHGAVAHYCQGYEASYTHNTADHPLIDQVYRAPIPALTVSDHLGELLRRRYGRPSRTVTQPLEPFWRPGWRAQLKRRPAEVPRILIAGPWEGDWKGVRTGLEAVIQLRRSGLDCRVVRLSQFPLNPEERGLLTAEEYHHHLRPEQAAEVVQSCDLMLAPSWEQEGFGLPLLEAMAAGVPAVASDIAAFRGFAGEAAVLVPPGEPATFAGEARRILATSSHWRSLRRRGFRVAQRFAAPLAADSAEAALRWVASGRWREEMAQPDS